MAVFPATNVAPGSDFQLPQIRALTSLRFFAAFWVLMLHYRYGDLANQMPASFLFAKGFLGVPVFFILSGFILSYTYHASFATAGTSLSNLRSYVVARVARIYPVHVLMLLLFPTVLLPLGIWPRLEPDTPYTFVLSAFLVSAWGFTNHLVWNQSSWSISTELLCYLLFPGIMLLALRIPRVALWPAALVAGYAILAGLPLRGVLAVVPDLFVAHPILGMTIHFFTLFVLGVFVFLAYSATPGRLGPVLSTGAVVMLVSAIIWLVSLDGTEPWIYAAMAVLILVLAIGTGPAKALLSLGPLVYLGEISYSLYVIHEPVREAMYFVAGTRPLPFLFEVMVVVAAAAFMFHAVEKPARALIRGAWMRRTAPGVARLA